MAPNFLYEAPTWNRIYEILLTQAEKIQSDNYKPDIIVGVARGGIVPACILTDLLESADFALIQIEYYSGINQTRKEPILKQCLNTPLTDKKVLLVDDVSDSGRSLKLAKNHLQEQDAKEIRIATLYTKPATITPPDYYEKQTNSWIVFPWDAKRNSKKNHRAKRRQTCGQPRNHKISKIRLAKKTRRKIHKGHVVGERIAALSKRIF